MKQLARNFLLCAAVAGLAATAVQTAGAQTTSSDVLRRAAALADGVRSYTANVHADVAMHSFPFLSPSLDGVYYHKEPGKNKIVLTSGLPFIAKAFSKIYPEVESPSQWADVYNVTVESQKDGITTFKLVPKKHGRIDHIDARIDDKTGQVQQMRWNYNDGGYASLDQRYATIDGHELVTGQTGHLDVPHYNADLKSSFSGFKVNTPIPDSVFTAS